MWYLDMQLCNFV